MQWWLGFRNNTLHMTLGTQVSAVTREGFDDLLETLLLQAEIMELKADEQVGDEGINC